MTTKPHNLPKVKSGMASHADYDAHAQKLTVRFHNGSVFQYDTVPANIGATVMGAQSFGSAFNRHVVGKFAGRKL